MPDRTTEAHTMFGIDTDYNPITPTGDALLAELGIDISSVRETLADDRVRRCPDTEVLSHAVLADAALTDALLPEGSES